MESDVNFKVMSCCSMIGGGLYIDLYEDNRFDNEIECCFVTLLEWDRVLSQH